MNKSDIINNLSDIIDNNDYDPREFKRGEVYFVDLEDTGYGTKYLQTKTRPALIIQNNIGNAKSATLIIALITSVDKKFYPFHYKVNIKGRESTILLEQIMTVDKFRILEKITELTPQQIKEVDISLMYSLYLSRLSICNITSFEVVSMILEKTKERESIYFLFDLFYNNIPKQEAKVSLEDLQAFNDTITKEIQFDDLKKMLDCCRGLNFLLNHNEY